MPACLQQHAYAGGGDALSQPADHTTCVQSSDIMSSSATGSGASTESTAGRAPPSPLDPLRRPCQCSTGSPVTRTYFILPDSDLHPRLRLPLKAASCLVRQRPCGRVGQSRMQQRCSKMCPQRPGDRAEWWAACPAGRQPGADYLKTTLRKPTRQTCCLLREGFFQKQEQDYAYGSSPGTQFQPLSSCGEPSCPFP